MILSARRSLHTLRSHVRRPARRCQRTGPRMVYSHRARARAGFAGWLSNMYYPFANWVHSSGYAPRRKGGRGMTVTTQVQVGR